MGYSSWSSARTSSGSAVTTGSVARVLERLPDVPERVWIVVHYQHRVLAIHILWSGRVGMMAPGCGSFDRREREARTQSGVRPPWASTIPLQIASPRPVSPLSSQDSTRENFLNRYGSRSAGVPLEGLISHRDLDVNAIPYGAHPVRLRRASWPRWRKITGTPRCRRCPSSGLCRPFPGASGPAAPGWVDYAPPVREPLRGLRSQQGRSPRPRASAGRT